jgi:predicted PurR-regulated permease PerM
MTKGDDGRWHEHTSSTVTVHRIEISYKTILAVAFTVGGIWLLGILMPIVVVLVTALILTGTLSPFVRWLHDHGVDRTLAIAIVFLACAALIGGIGLLTVPSLLSQVGDTLSNLPRLQKSLALKLEASHFTAPLADAVRAFKPKGVLAHIDAASAVDASLDVVEVIGYGATAVVLAIYFIADSERTRGALFALFPRRYHVRLARVMLNLETIVGGYMRGQVITSIAIGVFTFGLLSVVRVPNAVALAGFAAVTDVVPFVGGLLATTPAVLMALTRNTATGVIVLGVMVGYQELETRVIVPRVYGRALRLSSAVVVIALLAGGKLGGIVGALLALPIAAALRMLIEELRVEMPGDDTDDPQRRARDARAERKFERETAGATPEEAAAVATDIAAAARKSEEARGQDPTTTPLTSG